MGTLGDAHDKTFMVPEVARAPTGLRISQFLNVFMFFALFSYYDLV